MSKISNSQGSDLEKRIHKLNEDIAYLESKKNNGLEDYNSFLQDIELKRDKAQAILDALNRKSNQVEVHIKELEGKRDKLLSGLEEGNANLVNAQTLTAEILKRKESHEKEMLEKEKSTNDLYEKNKNTEIYLESVNQDQVKREKGINARLAEISAREANLEAQNQAIIEKKSENEQVASKHTATTNELKNKELTLKQREQQLLSDQQEHQKQLRDLENLREEVTSRKREVENKEQVQSAMKDQLIERESQVQKKERDIQVRDKEYQIRLDEVTYRERVLKNKEKLLNTPEA